ncbi:MAG: DUF2752 domain-containing protein [Planctomycetaceae bacterium]
MSNTPANPACAIDHLEIVDEILSCERDEHRLQGYCRHQIEIMAIALVAIALTQILLVVDEHRIAIRFFPDRPLPESCPAKFMFHQTCPGCGLTRSILALAAGDFGRSLHFHRLGWVMALLIAVQIPYRLYLLFAEHDVIRDHPWIQRLGYAVIAALLLNWVYGFWAS